MSDFQFNLDRDLVFFDLESTGLNIMQDRIIQIALIKYEPGKAEPIELMQLINPGIPITKEAYEVHKISNEDVKNKPTFQQVGQKLFDFIGDADLAGYNSNRFDVPMLMEEFYRIGLDFDIDKRRLLDVQRIFHKMEPRTLKAALNFYCGKSLEDAHDALADTRATVDVLIGQINRYQNEDYEDNDGNIVEKPIRNDIALIADFINDKSSVDVTNRLKLTEDGKIAFNFGKYTGQIAAEVFKKEPSYYHWMMERDFSAQVKKIIKKVFESL